jgi:2-methylcitrate dehydratase PrpD
MAMPNWALIPAFMGSDAKLFTAAIPVRTGLDAVDAALAGLHGLANILETENGFLQKFADVPLPEIVTKGLGTRWHTQTISFKIYPGCAYLDSAVDCAIALHAELAAQFSLNELVGSITSIKLHASIFTVGMDIESEPFVRGPDSPLSALNFSSNYAVATALAYGTLSPSDFLPDQRNDPVRWALATKVQVVLDLELTERSLLATAPLGEALREGGTSAAEWLASKGGEYGSQLATKLGGPSSDFAQATKSIGARLEVELHDGTVLQKSCEAAKGSVGSSSPAQQWALMVDKFLLTGGHQESIRAVENLEDLSPSRLAREVEGALVLS